MLTPRDIAVVGAGISGIAAAAAIIGKGGHVTVCDRGKRIGGRMASRTLRDTGTPFDGRVVDYGASYFTARHPDFVAIVRSMVEAGVVREWTNSFHVHSDGVMSVSAGPMRFAAPGGLRSVVEFLAREVPDIRQESEVREVDADEHGAVVDGQRSAAVALCMPTPQAQRLLPTNLKPPSEGLWEPVIAVTMVFEENRWLDFDGMFVNDNPVITWLADDGKRRGDQAPVLVAHVHPVLAAGHLERPHEVVPNAISATRRILAINALPEWTWAHRWSVAKPREAVEDEFWLHQDRPVGLAGDAWAGGPRIETAWLSGRALGNAIADRVIR